MAAAAGIFSTLSCQKNDEFMEGQCALGRVLRAELHFHQLHRLRFVHARRFASIGAVSGVVIVFSSVSGSRLASCARIPSST